MWQTHKQKTCEWKVERNRTQSTEQVMAAVAENATCEVYIEYTKQEKKQKNIVRKYHTNS